MRKRSMPCVMIGLAIILLCGCASIQSEFQKAQQKDAIWAYQRFIDKYPNTELAEQAQRRIDELCYQEDELRFLEVKGLDKFRAYQKFLAEYPDNRFAEEARSEMEKFEVVKLDRSISRKWSDFPEIEDVDLSEEETKLRIIVQARMTQCWSREELDMENPIGKLSEDVLFGHITASMAAGGDHWWLFDAEGLGDSIIIEPHGIKLVASGNLWREVETKQIAWIIIGGTGYKKNLTYQSVSPYAGGSEVKSHIMDVEASCPIFGIGSELRFDGTDWVDLYGIECRGGGAKISEFGVEFFPGTEIAVR